MEIATPLILQEIKAGAGISLSQAAGMLPGVKKKTVNSATVFRWCMKGIKIFGGTRIRLEHMRIGTRLFTTEKAIERFVIAINDSPTETHTIRSSAQRSRASVIAENELKKLGV